jgi:NAD(P)-dependent dehydrogenase (short-subunit alcohol dehydrogenase family)
VSAQGGSGPDASGAPRRLGSVPDHGRIALVSRGDEGVGPHVVQRLAALGMRVVLACRSVDRGRLVIDGLGELADRVAVRQLHTNDPSSVERLTSWVADRLGRCDVLIDNLVLGPADGPGARGLDLERVRRELWTDLRGTWRLAHAVSPMMRATGYGRVTTMVAGDPAPSAAARIAHRMTCETVDSFIGLLSEELAGDGILVNAYCRRPGDTGTPDATVEVPLWLATLPDHGPTGRLFDQAS